MLAWPALRLLTVGNQKKFLSRRNCVVVVVVVVVVRCFCFFCFLFLHCRVSTQRRLAKRCATAPCLHVSPWPHLLSRARETRALVEPARVAMCGHVTVGVVSARERQRAGERAKRLLRVEAFQPYRH